MNASSLLGLTVVMSFFLLAAFSYRSSSPPYGSRNEREDAVLHGLLVPLETGSAEMKPKVQADWTKPTVSQQYLRDVSTWTRTDILPNVAIQRRTVDSDSTSPKPEPEKNDSKEGLQARDHTVILEAYLEKRRKRIMGSRQGNLSPEEKERWNAVTQLIAKRHG